MSDNEKNFINRDRINVNEKNELQYWCEKYNIPPEEIKKTIDIVGSLVKDVEKQLGRSKKL